jgi:hypothetical protein
MRLQTEQLDKVRIIYYAGILNKAVQTFGLLYVFLMFYPIVLFIDELIRSSIGVKGKGNNFPFH